MKKPLPDVAGVCGPTRAEQEGVHRAGGLPLGGFSATTSMKYRSHEVPVWTRFPST